MSRFVFSNEDMVIIGFTKKDNSFLVNNKPRIFLGVKDDSGEIFKIGFSLEYKNRKLSMYRCLKKINYDIDICDINTNFMEKQDIETYDIINKNRRYHL